MFIHVTRYYLYVCRFIHPRSIWPRLFLHAVRVTSATLSPYQRIKYKDRVIGPLSSHLIGSRSYLLPLLYSFFVTLIFFLSLLIILLFKTEKTFFLSYFNCLEIV